MDKGRQGGRCVLHPPPPRTGYAALLKSEMPCDSPTRTPHVGSESHDLLHQHKRRPERARHMALGKAPSWSCAAESLQVSSTLALLYPCYRKLMLASTSHMPAHNNSPFRGALACWYLECPFSPFPVPSSLRQMPAHSLNLCRGALVLYCKECPFTGLCLSQTRLQS